MDTPSFRTVLQPNSPRNLAFLFTIHNLYVPLTVNTDSVFSSVYMYTLYIQSIFTYTIIALRLFMQYTFAEKAMEEVTAVWPDFQDLRPVTKNNCRYNYTKF